MTLRNNFAGRVFHAVGHDEVQSGLLQNLLPLFDVRAFETNDHRNLDAERF